MIVFGLAPPQEPADAAVLADRPHLLAPAGQHLVDVGLVADVPDDCVTGRVKNVVEAEGELDDAQVQGEMAAGLGDGADQLVADLAGQDAELRNSQSFQIGGRVDRLVETSH